ncbi:putative hotdog family 3-hydroxylacyl-ACP dehydratase, partial [Spirosoma sp. LMG 31448]|nr:putative hotdog family 3-hydroxylacyl-ACP dehydratase [Spirosoma utsteinense]
VLILIVKRKFKIFFESFATHSVLFILVGSAVADQEARVSFDLGVKR